MSHANVRVENRRGIEAAVKALRRACADAGIPKELKKREFFETKSQKRRRKQRDRKAEIAREESYNGKNRFSN